MYCNSTCPLQNLSNNVVRVVPIKHTMIKCKAKGYLGGCCLPWDWVFNISYIYIYMRVCVCIYVCMYAPILLLFQRSKPLNPNWKLEVLMGLGNINGTPGKLLLFFFFFFYLHKILCLAIPYLKEQWLLHISVYLHIGVQTTEIVS